MSPKLENAPGLSSEELDFRTEEEKKEEKRKRLVAEIQKANREHATSTASTPEEDMLKKEEKESDWRDQDSQHPRKIRPAHPRY
ncbi:hypothetical protein HYZ82_01985 [Candidatus Nomurabacteria bacterium]|nr:hypothetical protein [Candidatus Nomurabacteria bacterium]